MSTSRRPDGCHYYAESEDRKFRFIAWNAPPSTGDRACLGLTGRTEDQLVRDILDGRYNHIFERKAAEV